MATDMQVYRFRNPFRPGAGQMPPYLAGREDETKEFSQIIAQDPILQNVIITGLRGLGKTVLLETLKPIAVRGGWFWAGTDLSESATITEENTAIRLLTDLSIVSSQFTIAGQAPPFGFSLAPTTVNKSLNYATLMEIYNGTPGLIADKVKAVFLTTWRYLSSTNKRGVIFAYDEAQNMADHHATNQFPLSLLLDVFASIQKQGIPFMLVLTGLPTLFPKLVEARTFSERMFHIIALERLDEKSSRDAIVKPIEAAKCPVKFDDQSVKSIYTISAGYPYFIQYVCREVFDVWVQDADAGNTPRIIPTAEIIRKLDQDFFAGRWARASDRQRDLLWVISKLENCDTEFTVQEVVEQSKQVLPKPFSSSHANQMLAALSANGLIYKNRYGKYSFAVPLMGQFIRRTMGQAPQLQLF